MSCIEHLIENGLGRIKKSDYSEWKKAMSEDVNFKYCSLTLDELWEICQYVQYVAIPCAVDDKCSECEWSVWKDYDK